MTLKKQKGVSLITLVITIIVIIILATITIQRSSDIPNEAHYTKYMQTMKDVQIGVENRKILNSRKGTTEEKLTEGFIEVTLENAPLDFASFDEPGSPIKGYMVDLEEIGYDEAAYGKAYKEVIGDASLTFGEARYDVYVFDAEWQVYYVKGLKYDGSMNYTFK